MCLRPPVHKLSDSPFRFYLFFITAFLYFLKLQCSHVLLKFHYPPGLGLDKWRRIKTWRNSSSWKSLEVENFKLDCGGQFFCWKSQQFYWKLDFLTNCYAMLCYAIYFMNWVWNYKLHIHVIRAIKIENLTMNALMKRLKLYRNKSNHTKCLVRKWMCSASFAKKYQDWINSNKKDYRKYDRWVLEKIIYITPLKSSYLSVEKFLCPISAYPNYRGTSCRGVTIFRNTATQNPIWNGDRYLSQDVLSRLPSITARWDSCNIPLTIWDIIFCRKWAWLFWSREKYSSILWNNETTNSFRQPGVGKWPNTNINCRLLLAAPMIQKSSHA